MEWRRVSEPPWATWTLASHGPAGAPPYSTVVQSSTAVPPLPMPMPSQSPRRSRLRFDVKRMPRDSVPWATRLPRTWMPRRLLNLTTTPGSRVSVTPAGTTTSQVTMKGPSSAFQSVSLVIVPQTVVGPEVTRFSSATALSAGILSGPWVLSSAIVAEKGSTVPTGTVVETLTTKGTETCCPGFSSGVLNR